MDGLLHWDFSHGLAVEAQVRRRFGSSVHFSPSRGAKEFFLVVSFSSASFELSEDSVGWALQSCIGGDHKGFKVYQLSDRRFRFSVASNKVGHFIYGLRDRIWPDFVCHFTLFRGVHPSITGFHHAGDFAWKTSPQILEVAQRSPTKFTPSLSVLKDSARGDNSSAAELAKFGFVLDNSVHQQKSLKASSSLKFGDFSIQNWNNLESSSNNIQPCTSSLFFGSFLTPIISDHAVFKKCQFFNDNYVRDLCRQLPKELLPLS
jgi:hypothetical protein